MVLVTGGRVVAICSDEVVPEVVVISSVGISVVNYNVITVPTKNYSYQE